MAHIDELISSGDERGAATRYARLWKVVRSITLGNPTLIQALVAAGLSERLVEFYVEEREPALRLLDRDIEGFDNLQSSLTSPTFADLLLNPFLTAVQTAFLPNLDQFVVRKTRATARLAAFRFIMEATESGRLGEVPVDPLTGEPFAVTAKGDEYEIASGYLQGGEPAVRHEFRLR